MRLAHYYWLIIAVLAVIHLDFASRALTFDLPFYASIVIAIIVVWMISSKIIIHMGELDSKENLRLYSLQIIVILLYIVIEPGVGSILPLLLFVGVELIRHTFGKKLARSNLQLRSQSDEVEQMNDTFLVVRKERHDFLKHISALHYMMEQNRHEGAFEYLNELVEGYKETNLSIQGERGTVAGILHHYYGQGKAHGIEVVYDLETAISTLPLSNHDVTALVGNVLSNALEASEEWQKETGKQATITLQAYKRSGLFILTCKNNTLSLPNDILDDMFTKQVKSTKTGSHEGLGTSIIAEITEKHTGHLDFIYKNETFTLQIKLPVIENSI